MSETTVLLTRLKAAGLSQMEISRRTGIPQPRLSRWAAGETPEAADDALRLRALTEDVCRGPERPPEMPGSTHPGAFDEASEAA